MTQQHPQPDMKLAAQVISEKTLDELRLDLQNTMLPAEILQAIETAITEREADDRLHDLSRTAIGERYHLHDWVAVASELGISESELTELRSTEPYEMQVWADYGRTCWRFSKHPKRETCVEHISQFYGITETLASEILGNDWKAPEPVQLTFMEI